MHTSQTTHHRIFFANVTKPDYLEGLCKDLGFEKVDDTTYDLVLQEGSQLTVEEACRVAVGVAALGNPNGDAQDLLFMLGCIARLLMERGYLPHSSTFEADVDLETLDGVDISCLELFDLLSALSYGYEVKGIYTQWAMTSNRAVFGGNAGGTRITMRSFSIPCQVYPDRAEHLIDLLAKHKDSEIGDVFAMEFILPLIEKPMILTKEMELSIQASLHRFFGGLPKAGLEEIVPERLRTIGESLSKLTMKPEYQFQSPAVLRKPRQAPTLDDFRNFQAQVPPYTRFSEAQQFYIAWFGVQLLPSGHCPQLPADFELQVDNIRAHLAAGHDIECPAIHKFHNPDPIRIECEIPTIMPRAPEAGEIEDVLGRGRDVVDRDTHRPINRQLVQTGFEHDAKPLDTADLQDIHLRGVSLARSSQQADHTYGGVPMEQTGKDWSQESSSRFSSPDPSPSPTSDSSSNDTSSSSPSD